MTDHAILFSALIEKRHTREVSYTLQEKCENGSWKDCYNSLGDKETYKALDFVVCLKKFRSEDHPDIEYRVMRTETLSSRYKQVVA